MSQLDRDCRELEEDLSAFADRELSGAPQARLREHLASCASCRARLAAFEGVDAALRALEPTPVPDALLARTRERIVAEGRSRVQPAPPRRPLRWLAVPAGLAAAAAALALALLWSPRWSEHPAAAPDVAELPVAGVLARSSDEELELALALDALGDLSPEDDLALIEQLDLLERLDQLDARERG